MGRRNRRYTKRPREPLVIVQHIQQPKKSLSRCAFCGRLLDDGDFYWFPDEFGQFVRRCKNERICSSQRKTAAEEAFREALRRNHKGKGYWK